MWTRFTQVDPDYPIFVIEDYLDERICTEFISYVNATPASETLQTELNHESFVFPKDYELAGILDWNLHCLLQIPYTNGSNLCIKRYPIGGYIKPHYDLLNPGNPEHAKRIDNSGQTPISILIYLNDVEEGGETHFVYPDIKIRPQKGRLVMWYNLDENGMPYPDLKHAGLEVVSNPKYIITKFFTEYPVKNREDTV